MKKILIFIICLFTLNLFGEKLGEITFRYEFTEEPFYGEAPAPKKKGDFWKIAKVCISGDIQEEFFENYLHKYLQEQELDLGTPTYDKTYNPLNGKYLRQVRFNNIYTAKENIPHEGFNLYQSYNGSPVIDRDMAALAKLNNLEYNRILDWQEWEYNFTDGYFERYGYYLLEVTYIFRTILKD